MNQTNHEENTILLQAGVSVLLLTLVLAWTLAFARIFPIELIADSVKDYDRLVQGHIDYLLMGALLLGFYGARVPLPVTVRSAMAIGAFTNPAGFIYFAFWPEGLNLAIQVATICSFIITSYGFGMACILALRSTLTRDAGAAAGEPAPS